jgi:hypothetical protein
MACVLEPDGGFRSERPYETVSEVKRLPVPVLYLYKFTDRTCIILYKFTVSLMAYGSLLYRALLYIIYIYISTDIYIYIYH